MDERREDKLDRIIAEDPRYPREAYLFLFGALEYKLKQLEERRHISGQELIGGIRDYAAELYGPTARLGKHG